MSVGGRSRSPLSKRMESGSVHFSAADQRGEKVPPSIRHPYTFVDHRSLSVYHRNCHKRLVGRHHIPFGHRSVET